MSDLKLYRGINNIDDDLIEEADRRSRPVVHRFYAFAASAAALLITVGASGYFSGADIGKKTVFPDSGIVIEATTASGGDVTPVTTSAVSGGSTAATAASAATQTVINTQTTAVHSLNNTITTALVTGKAALTGKVPAVTSAAAGGRDIEAGEPTVTGAPAKEDEYIIEGSTIMKKYAALFASLLTLSNAAAVNAQAGAQTFVPKNENLSVAMNAKTFIEKYDVDIDFNCDGKFDIFDVYAYYRAEIREADERNAAIPRCTVPDYIWEKYKAIPADTTLDYTYIDSETGEEKSYTAKKRLVHDDLLDYYFEYVAPPQPEFMDTNFYIDNCPDDYGDPMSYDIIRHDGDLLSMWDFQRTEFSITDDGENYRLVDRSVAENIPSENRDNMEYGLGHLRGVRKSLMHEFIKDVRRHAHYTGEDRAFVKQFIEDGRVDPDVNADGTFDMDDVGLTAFYANLRSNSENYTYFYSLLYQTSVDYYREHMAEINPTVSAEDWGRAYTLCDTLANYCDIDNEDIVQYLAEYYLTYNEADSKYFDPMYYVDKGYTYYRVMHGFQGRFFQTLGYYENFAIKYGPSAANNTIAAPEGYWFTQDEIDAAFPQYYKDVKTGVLPEPDIDLNGKIDAADYNLLFNLGYEAFTPYDTSYIGSMIRRHPELNIVLDVPEEVRENFNTNYDFNHNGISCDTLESDCMMMYILSELEAQYEEEKDMFKAMDDYYVAHRGAQYFEVFDNNMEKFYSDKGLEYTGYMGRYDTAPVMSYVETIKSYKSFPQNIGKLTEDDHVTGDANCDGKVDLSDAILIMQAISNPDKYGTEGSDDKHLTRQGSLNGDVDKDTEGITSNDALMIQEYLIGKVSTLG